LPSIFHFARLRLTKADIKKNADLLLRLLKLSFGLDVDAVGIAMKAKA
jgi:hypothetical protein